MQATLMSDHSNDNSYMYRPSDITINPDNMSRLKVPMLKLGNLDGGGMDAFRNSYNSSYRGNMKYTEADEYKEGSSSRRQTSTNRASIIKKNATIYIEDNNSYQDEEGDMMMYDLKYNKMKTEARPSPAHPHLSANSVMFGRSP